jgi:hypothetical protein
MASARYWRVVGLETYGGDLELSSLQLHDAVGRVDAPATLTSSQAPSAGSLANLQDGNTATTCGFTAAQLALPSFAISWDFGAPTDVIALVPASGPTQTKFLAKAILQASADALTWVTFYYYDRLAWPGVSTLASVVAVDFSAASISAAVSLLDSSVDLSSFAHAATLGGAPGYVDLAGGTYGSRGLQLRGGMSLAYAVSGAEFTMPGDWCIYGFIYPTSFVSAAGGNNDGAALSIILGTSTSGGKITINSITNGSVYANLSGVSQWPGLLNLVINKLQYFEIGRTETTMYGSVDGTITGSSTLLGTTTHGNPGLFISASTNNGIGSTLANIKVAKGLGPRTSNFIPPMFSSWLAAPALTTPQAIHSSGFVQGTGSTVWGSAAAPVGAVKYEGFTASDVQNGGVGRVYGTVEQHSTPNFPLYRRVQLMDERSGLLVREMWSDPITGAYEFPQVKMGVPYTIIARDHTHTYGAIIADRVFAGAV